MNTDYVSRHKLNVNSQFADFVENELLPHLAFTYDEFWLKLAYIISIFT